MARVSEFRKECAKGKLALSIDVMNFLKDWLRTHIKGGDIAYSIDSGHCCPKYGKIAKSPLGIT